MEPASTGPQLFLQRLRRFATFPAGVQLCNPSLQDVACAKAARNVILIARLDGTSYYKVTGRNLLGLIEQRRPKWVSRLALLDAFDTYPRLSSVLLNRFLDRGAVWLLKNADGIVFQSEISREMHCRFLGYKVGTRPESIILNGVPLDEFTPLPNATRLSGEPAVLISASIYRLHKRLADSIRLVNLLAKNYPGARLHVLGDFDTLVRRSIHAENTERCEFYGRVTASKLPDFYRGADIQLSLSLFDPCPNVVSEGLASGLPVVTPVQSGAAELVGEENSDWVVNEKMPLDYHEFHVPERIPAAPADAYIARIALILEQLSEHKARARYRAERNLDIRQVATRYSEFAQRVVALREC